jgi:putative transposase
VSPRVLRDYQPELLRAINHLLVMAARKSKRRKASPSTVAIDSQNVDTTDSSGARGFDAGNLVKGREWHVVIDARNLMVGAMGPLIGVQDLKGTPRVLRSIRMNWPWLTHVFVEAATPG